MAIEEASKNAASGVGCGGKGVKEMLRGMGSLSQSQRGTEAATLNTNGGSDNNIMYLA